MNKQKLTHIISKGETPKVDFKLKLSLDTESTKKEFSKDVAAIANTRGGRGYLIFGVEDKTHLLVGISVSDFHEEKLQQIISSRTDPPIPIKLNIVKMDNDIILAVITILNSNQKPHQVRENGSFYIRRGSTTDFMRKDEIASMIQEHGLLPYETIPISTSSPSDLNINLLFNYLKKFNIENTIDYNILYSLGILYKESDSSVFLPTYGGVLLFCDYPQKFLPHCIIRIHNHNNTLSSPIIICDGNILDMLNYAANIINICKPPSIPIEVIEDLLGNSVVHRDYFFINTPIEVYIKEDSIEIINPGFKKHRDNTETYIRRNMWLYLKLLSLDSTKRFYNKSIKAKSYSNNEITIRYYNIKVKNLFKVVVKCK